MHYRIGADVETGNSKLVSERKLTKTVISSKARNLIVLKIQTLKISPYGRNDKKRGFRSDTNFVKQKRVLSMRQILILILFGLVAFATSVYGGFWDSALETVKDVTGPKEAGEAVGEQNGLTDQEILTGLREA